MKRIIVAFVFWSLLAFESNAQSFESLVGARFTHNTAVFSAKIPLDEKNALEGNVGIFTPQPTYTVGASAAYHRQILLNEEGTFFAHLGGGVSGVIGDEQGVGLALNSGISYIYKKINIGVDANPTYFFNDALELEPIFGVHLRWVNN